MRNEVIACYQAAWQAVTGRGKPPPYRDYIAWLRQQDLAEAQRFWTAALDGVPVTRVASTAPVHGGSDGTGAVERRIVALPPALTEGLREAAASHRVTLGAAIVPAVWACCRPTPTPTRSPSAAPPGPARRATARRADGRAAGQHAADADRGAVRR